MIEFIPAADESLAHFTDWVPSGRRWVFDASFPPPTHLGVVMADALNVHEATCLTPSQLQARVAELEAALASQDRVLRSSVPERWKGCASPVGSAQSYIAELEQALLRVRQEAVADDQDDWFRAAGEAVEP